MQNTEKYTRFALCREMMQTADIIRNFKLTGVQKPIEAIKKTGKILFTGEGSSRIFPAKNAIFAARRAGIDINFATDGARQCGEYDLRGFTVFGASNSGKTKEVIWLFDRLKKVGYNNLFALTANSNTPLEALSNQGFLLSCGKEDAVAATKSVAEQALFYVELLERFQGKSLAGKLNKLADAVHKAMAMPIPQEMIKAVAKAGTIYFAGRNDGVAEELTLKTNEIARKKSDFLEGTYAVHGIEEVMNPDDVVIVVNPFAAEQEKFKQVLVDGVGMKVFAVSDEDTIFPTLKTPAVGQLQNFVYLAAGWNILVEVGLSIGIDLDKPARARKVGNEFIG